MKVSVITPTYFRFLELKDYFLSLEKQTFTPFEVIIVDGAPEIEQRTCQFISLKKLSSNLNIKYFRKQGGTAVQRNFGVNMSSGDLVLFIDDDVRIEPNFIQILVDYFVNDINKEIAGITGYRKNCYFDISKSTRWIWYKRFKLLTLYDPGFYDIQTGIPVNNNAQIPFIGIRTVDFMTTACTMYRKEVFHFIEFDPYFVGYGILEDAHFSLRVKFKLNKLILQCGDAKCIELSASSGRADKRIIAIKTVLNYFYTFNSVFGPLSRKQKIRFLKFQIFEWIRAYIDFLRFRNVNSLKYFLGKTQGLFYLLLKKY